MKTTESQDPHRDPYIFETRDVLSLTGVSAIYLNKWIEHGSFGIKPSIRKGTGRGSRRLFSDEDLLGIALVWTLFQIGLRSKVISQVLKGARAITTPQGLATDAANSIAQDWGASHEGPHVLVIRRKLVRDRAKKAELRVLLEASDYAHPIEGLTSELVVPVDLIFADVNKKIQRFSSKGRA